MTKLHVTGIILIKTSAGHTYNNVCILVASKLDALSQVYCWVCKNSWIDIILKYIYIFFGRNFIFVTLSALVFVVCIEGRSLPCKQSQQWLFRSSWHWGLCSQAQTNQTPVLHSWKRWWELTHRRDWKGSILNHPAMN